MWSGARGARAYNIRQWIDLKKYDKKPARGMTETTRKDRHTNKK